MGNFSPWLTGKAMHRIHDGLHDLRREIDKLPPDSKQEADKHLYDLNLAICKPLHMLRAICQVPYDLKEADGKPIRKTE